jgi:hypothetical protein
MKGRINRIWTNERKDGTKYWVLSIDGQRYSVWNQELVEGLNEGDVVDFEFKQSGNFRNITKLSKIKEQIYANDTQKQIVRMSCLRSAAELLSDSGLTYDVRVKEALKVANKFEQWVIGHGRRA